MCALRDLVHEDDVVTVEGEINAQAEGECIICSRPLLHCLSAQTKPVMHTKLVFLVLLTYPKQPLVFEKCALSDLKRGHLINSEESDSLRVT